MTAFETTVAASVESYIALQRSLGYQFVNKPRRSTPFLCTRDPSVPKAPCRRLLLWTLSWPAA